MVSLVVSLVVSSVDGDISYWDCSVWGLVLGQVYCHYDYYNFSRELQGGPKNVNFSRFINSNFIISCDSIAVIENIFPCLNNICGRPSLKTEGRFKILNENGERQRSHLLK